MAILDRPIFLVVAMVVSASATPISAGLAAHDAADGSPDFVGELQVTGDHFTFAAVAPWTDAGVDPLNLSAASVIRTLTSLSRPLPTLDVSDVAEFSAQEVFVLNAPGAFSNASLETLFTAIDPPSLNGVRPLRPSRAAGNSQVGDRTGGSVAVVPEPATWILMLLGLPLVRRRSMQRRVRGG